MVILQYGYATDKQLNINAATASKPDTTRPVDGDESQNNYLN